MYDCVLTEDTQRERVLGASHLSSERGSSGLVFTQWLSVHTAVDTAVPNGWQSQ